MSKPMIIEPATTKELINGLEVSISDIEERERQGVSFPFDSEDKIKMYKELESLKEKLG